MRKKSKERSERPAIHIDLSTMAYLLLPFLFPRARRSDELCSLMLQLDRCIDVFQT